MTKETRN